MHLILLACWFLLPNVALANAFLSTAVSQELGASKFKHSLYLLNSLGQLVLEQGLDQASQGGAGRHDVNVNCNLDGGLRKLALLWWVNTKIKKTRLSTVRAGFELILAEPLEKYLDLLVIV